MSEKVRENYARRQAARVGMILTKSRAKKRSIDNCQGYRLQDARAGNVLHGEKFDLSLQDVEGILNAEESA